MIPSHPWLARLRRPSRDPQGRRRPAPRRPVAAAERLENRELLTAYVVDSLDDVVAADGKLTLREAIEAANTDAAVHDAAAGEGGGVVDSITFDASLSDGTITLNGSELTVTGALSITGLGSGDLTIDADESSRVFIFNVGCDVTMSGVTVTGGRTTGAVGSGIINRGTLDLTDVVVTDNASLTGDAGGGIYNNPNAVLTLSDCTVSGNSAGVGGGIYASGSTVTLTNATVSGNSATGDGSGGGIYAYDSTVTLTNVTVSGNSVDGDGSGGGSGGGIYALDSTVTLTNVTVSGNSIDTYGNGGGIYAFNSTVTLANATVSGNSFDLDGNGGGIYALLSTVTLTNATVSGNSVARDGNGGGIYALDSTVTLTNVTVSGNSVTGTGNGGGVYVFGGSTTLKNTIVIGNRWGGSASDIGRSGPNSFAGSDNLIGDAATAGGLTNGANGNIVGADVADVLDPVLRNNGGPTLTHALVADSLAIDAGSNALALDAGGGPLATDQRGAGYARILNGTVDIGAFELLATDPVAKDDAASVDEDDTLDGDLFAANGSGADSDPNGDPLTVTAVDGFPAKVGTEVSLASGALLTVEADGTFTYDPNFAFDALAAGAAATDSFTYTISDGNGGTSTATVTITIDGVNTGPYVEFDAVRVRNDHIASINVTANDSDPEGGSLALIAGPGQAPLGDWEDLPSGARVKREADGTITLDPYAAYNRLKAGESAIEWVLYRVAEPGGLFSDGILRVVIYGSGTTDLVGYADGEWWATEAGGAKTSRLAKWADVAWDALHLADIDGDGVTDLIGLLDGRWYVGRGVAGGFLISAPARWQNTDWRDVAVQDVDGDGKADLVGRAAGQWWVALSTSTGGTISFAAATRWATWADAAWDEVFVQDIDGDGRSDLLGMIDGQWWSALSDGSSFGTSELWAVWADVEWDAIGTFDPDYDGFTDVYGLLNGRWYVGLSCGCYFTTVLWDSWSAGEWKDARSGDFDGDGFDDLAARIGGTWYVAYSDPFGPVTRDRWATWTDADWQDVRVGDFDGDGREDLIGRVGRQWWLSRSNGTTVSTGRFVDWANLDWQIWATELRQEVGSSGGGASHAPTPGRPAPPLPAISPAEDDALTSFWAAAADDDEFALRLAAA